MTMKMFEDMTDEIFKDVGITKADYAEEWQECVDILSMQMAMASSTMGLTYERAAWYERQKQVLAEDLRAIKKERMN